LPAADNACEEVVMVRRFRWQRSARWAGFLLASGLSLAPALGAAEEPSFPVPITPRELPPAAQAACPGPHPALQGPIVSEGHAPPPLPPAQPGACEKPLPINLATALRLAGARPVIITAAQASVDVAAAELARARVAWLPSVYVGAGYYRHDGATQGQSGNFYINSKDQFLAGGGLTARVAVADALFAPLAARQVLRARQIDVQTARNDALLATAEAYFDVQQARGRLAGTQDVVDKALSLRDKARSLALGQFDPTDVHRALAELAEVEQSLGTAREQWQVASADLTQVLRLYPAAVVVPLEPPFLRVTLIGPHERVDDLIPVGLTNRPELASQQALVQAALVRIRQERLRPLAPSVVLEGGSDPAVPDNFLMGGVFGSGASGSGNPWMGREDVGVGLYWRLDNLGFGNRALVRERQAEQRLLLVDLFRLQDRVAAEVARAHAALESAAFRTEKAEEGLREAQLSYTGSLEELGKITQVGDVKVLTRRVFEVVDALRALQRAYDNYFLSVNDYNRAQFRLYRAMGYPAGILSCERPTGEIHPVDTTRPPQMAPVCAPDSCAGHR
jgi:outer membrane protein TolC